MRGSLSVPRPVLAILVDVPLLWATNSIRAEWTFLLLLGVDAETQAELDPSGTLESLGPLHLQGLPESYHIVPAQPTSPTGLKSGAAANYPYS